MAEVHPLHVVVAWLGNSQPVAMKHYLQVTDADFRRAAKALQYPPESTRTDQQTDGAHDGNTPAYGPVRADSGVCLNSGIGWDGPGGIRTHDQAIMSRLL